jgi:hypothetical protein
LVFTDYTSPDFIKSKFQIIKKLMQNSEFWTNALNFVGQAWWIEVLTTQPQCTYYGPFSDTEQAQIAMSGYIEDLESESAQGIQAQVKRCKPHQLTIDDELEMVAR